MNCLLCVSSVYLQCIYYLTETSRYPWVTEKVRVDTNALRLLSNRRAK